MEYAAARALLKRRPPPWVWTIVAALVTFAALLVVSYPRATPYNNYVYLAEAFLRGHVWVDSPGDYIDALLYGGRRYIIEGPMPGVLMMPAVAIWGREANQTTLSLVLCAIAAGAGWELARRLGVPWRSALVLFAFLLLGTDLFWCAIFGDVWFIAHVSACCFTLLALVELAGKKRAWLVMLWAVCAFESRFTLALAVPVYLYLLLADVPRTERLSRAFSAFAVLAFAAEAWLAYNRLRWGTWYDIGYTAWYHQDQAGEPTGSPFRLSYLPMQLQAFFVARPELYPIWPFVVPSRFGVALPWTSPGLLLALFAQRPVNWVVALWVATLLVAVPNFLYYVSGFVQFGMRHALDFEPFLFALMCLAAVRGLRWWWVVLCTYSALAGAWGTWFWITYYRNGS